MTNNKYKKPNPKELKALHEFVVCLHEAATFFKDHFVGKIMCYETSAKKVEVQFISTNFMHLCGIDYERGAKRFFEDCLDDRIQVNSIRVKCDGTTIQKLKVLWNMSELNGNNLRVTDSGDGLKISFDYAIRTRKQIFALALVNKRTRMIPISLLNLKSRNFFPSGDLVESIYSVNLNDNSITWYKQCNPDNSDN